MANNEQLENMLYDNLVATGDKDRAIKLINSAKCGDMLADYALRAAERYIKHCESIPKKEQQPQNRERDVEAFHAGYKSQAAAISLAVKREQRAIYGEFFLKILLKQSGHYVAGQRQAIRDICGINDNRFKK